MAIDDHRGVVAPVHHQLQLTDREGLSLDGVLGVVGFDQETITVDTQLGILVIRGAEMHIRQLDLDAGELAIDGQIGSMVYQPGSESRGNMRHSKGNLLGRLFR